MAALAWIVFAVSTLYWGIKLIFLILMATKFGYLDKVKLREPDKWPRVSVILTDTFEMERNHV